MMSSDGVAVLRGHELVTSGVCPREQEIRDLTQWLPTRSTQPIFSTDHLSSLYPPASDYTKTGSGLLAVALSTEEPWFLLWFRVEQIETVNWAGNPHKSNNLD